MLTNVRIDKYYSHLNKKHHLNSTFIKPTKIFPEQEDYFVDLFIKSFTACLTFDYLNEALSISVHSMSNKKFVVKKLQCHNNDHECPPSGDFCWQEFKEFKSDKDISMSINLTHYIENDRLRFWFLKNRSNQQYSVISITLIPSEFKKRKFVSPPLTNFPNFQIKSIIVSPCHSELSFNPKRKLTYPCQHSLYFSVLDKNNQEGNLFYFVFKQYDGEIIKDLGNKYPIYRVPCAHNAKCAFNNHPLYKNKSNQRALTISQKDTDFLNLEHITKSLITKNICAWIGMPVRFTVNDTTYLCKLTKYYTWDINLSSSDLQYCNLSFIGTQYHNGIERYFDVCINGERAKKTANENHDWGIYIKFEPVGTLLIQLESIVSYKQQRLNQLLPFMNQKIFDLPKTITLYSCNSHSWDSKWAGEKNKCEHKLYLIDKDSERPQFLNFLSYYSPLLSIEEIDELGLFSKVNIQWKSYEKLTMNESTTCKLIPYLLKNYPNVYNKMEQKNYY